jgi:hypothetical protein
MKTSTGEFAPPIQKVIRLLRFATVQLFFGGACLNEV